MLELADFVQLGLGGVAVVVSYLIVKEVLKSQREKDSQFIGFIKRQEDNFNEVVKNHLKHNAQATIDLEKTIKEFYSWLRNNNKRQ